MSNAAVERGVTPTHIFETGLDLREATVLFITYQQNDRTVLEKTLEDAELSETDIRVSLTQEETLRFRENTLVRIQIRAGFSDGRRVKSEIITTTADELLKEDVI